MASKYLFSRKMAINVKIDILGRQENQLNLQLSRTKCLIYIVDRQNVTAPFYSLSILNRGKVMQTNIVTFVFYSDTMTRVYYMLHKLLPPIVINKH